MKHLALVSVFVACTPAAPRGSVRVDLSSLYRQDGLSVRSTTKRPIDEMRYFLFADDAVTASGEVMADPETLAFSVDARAGTHRFALLARTGGELSYIGYVPEVVLRPLQETEVRVPFYPAGSVRFALSAKSRLVRGCDLGVYRSERLDDNPWEIHIRARFEGEALMVEDTADTIFGVNRVGVPAGDYQLSCVVDVAGQRLDLLKGTTLSVRQGEETVFTKTLDAPDVDDGPLTPPLAPAPAWFDVDTTEDGALQRNVVTNLGSARLRIAAKRVDGSSAADWSGRVRIRFLDIVDERPLLDVSRILPITLGAGAKASGPNVFEADLLQGSLELPLSATSDVLTVVQVVAVDTASGVSIEHTQGVAMLHASAETRCAPYPLDASELGGASLTHRVVILLESESLGTNGARAVDSHVFLGITAHDQSGGSRLCASSGITTSAPTDVFPGLTLGFFATPALSDVAVFINPQGGALWQPLFTANGFDLGHLPASELATGQRFLPNSVRASDERVAAGAAVTLTSAAFYYTSPQDNPMAAGGIGVAAP